MSDKTIPAPKSKKRTRKSFEQGRVYIRASYNNTVVTLADPSGNVLGWSSPGANGFKGARQATPYAGQVSAEKVVEKAKTFGIKDLDVYMKGMGPAREQALRGLIDGGLNIISITEESRLPHGGCRPRRNRKP